MHPRPALICAAVLFSLALLASPLFAQPDTDETISQLKDKVSRFFQNLNNDELDPQKTFDDLLAHGPLEKREEIKGLMAKAVALESMYGEFLESESIGAKKIGKDLVLLKYLYKMKKYPVVWYFTYYRPPSLTGEENRWFVVAVRFDTRLDLLDLTNDKSN